MILVTKQLHKYIGIPYLTNGRTMKGVDCWGLVCLIYKEILNLDLPLINTEYSNGLDVNDTKSVFMKYEKLFVDCGDFETVRKPETFDLLLFKRSGFVSHVGLVIDDNYFIHADLGADSCVERIAHRYWNRRISGIYRCTKLNVK